MQCPGCGRPIDFEEKFAKVIACKYCNSILEFGQWELTKIGEQGDFIEFPSLFQVWKIIDFKWKKINVKWQMRCEYDGGFFDIFYVQIDDKNYYIREDDGTYSITQKAKFEENSVSLIDKIAGSTFEFKDASFYIEEVGIFKLTSIKWYVNTKLIPGREYEYLTGIYRWSKYFFEKNTQENMLRVFKEVQSFGK